MSRNVIQFHAKSAGASDDAAHPSNRKGRQTWEVSSLLTETGSRQWLLNSVLGAPFEGTALSLWMHHPNLRESTVRLVHHLSPLWTSMSGECVASLAVERAVRGAERAVENREAFEGRLIGVYLYGLVSVVEDVARLDVTGVDTNGFGHRWDHFSKPLQDWARGYGMSSLFATPRPTPVTDVVLSGLKTHMTARIADPVDAGYLAKYAPQG